MSNVENIFDLENFKCCDYYHYLIKQKFEKPNKWAKLREEFNLEDKQLSEVRGDNSLKIKSTIMFNYELYVNCNCGKN